MAVYPPGARVHRAAGIYLPAVYPVPQPRRPRGIEGPSPRMGQNRYDPAPPLTGAAQRLRCQRGRRSSGPRLLLPRDVTVILLCAARRMSSALTPRVALVVSGPVGSDSGIRLPFGEALEARCGPPRSEERRVGQGWRSGVGLE